MREILFLKGVFVDGISIKYEGGYRFIIDIFMIVI